MGNELPDVPAVRVGCLKCYNHGHLVGEWFEITDRRKGEFEDEIDDFMESHEYPASAEDGYPHEEWDVFDTIGIRPSLYTKVGLWHLIEVADLMEEHGLAFILWAEEHLQFVESGEAEDRFNSAFIGHFNEKEDFCREYFDRITGVPLDDWLRSYIDWETVYRDAHHGEFAIYEVVDDGAMSDRGIYVFNI